MQAFGSEFRSPKSIFILKPGKVSPGEADTGRSPGLVGHPV